MDHHSNAIQIIVDGKSRPPPRWLAAMLAEPIPATVGDFVAKFAGDLVREGRWAVEVSQAGVGERLRSALAIHVRTIPVADADRQARGPTAEMLANAGDVHRRSADSLRRGSDSAAADLEDVREFWETVGESLDALSEMGTLPTTIKADALELQMRRINDQSGSDDDGAAKAIEELGFLAEQWSRELSARAITS